MQKREAERSGLKASTASFHELRAVAYSRLLLKNSVVVSGVYTSSAFSLWLRRLESVVGGVDPGRVSGQQQLKHILRVEQ